MAETLMVIGAVTGTVGTLASISQQRKAARLSRQQQAVATRRSRRQAIRERQIRRAQALATAQGAGALGGSGVAGGVGSLSSQLGSELGFSSQMSGLSRQISSAQSSAQTFGGLAEIGGTAYSFGASGGSLGDLFNIKPNRPPQQNFGSQLYGNSAFPDSF